MLLCGWQCGSDYRSAMVDGWSDHSTVFILVWSQNMCVVHLCLARLYACIVLQVRRMGSTCAAALQQAAPPRWGPSALWWRFAARRWAIQSRGGCLRRGSKSQVHRGFPVGALVAVCRVPLGDRAPAACATPAGSRCNAIKIYIISPFRTPEQQQGLHPKALLLQIELDADQSRQLCVVVNVYHFLQSPCRWHAPQAGPTPCRLLMLLKSSALVVAWSRLGMWLSCNGETDRLDKCSMRSWHIAGCTAQGLAASERRWRHCSAWRCPQPPHWTSLPVIADPAATHCAQAEKA